MSVALDEADAAREWVEAAQPTHPVLIDPDHVVAERYGILNIPTVLWIDEDDRIVRPPDITPADDMWREFTGIDSAVHHDALREWVRTGAPPMAADDVARLLPEVDADDRIARLERRLGAYLRRHGRAEAARRHLDRAVELAPLDWTVRRASMPMRDEDPFGAPFFEFMGEWAAAGSPGYEWGNSAARRDG